MNNKVSEHNRALFEEFRALNLPLGEYAIVTSGVIAVRGIREAGDIDVIASEKLWGELKKKYEVNTEGGFDKISASPNVDILWKGTFEQLGGNIEGAPSQDEQIRHAEVIDGLSFQSLEHWLWFKTNMGTREKNKNDIELVKEYLKDNPEEKSGLRN